MCQSFYSGFGEHFPGSRIRIEIKIQNCTKSTVIILISKNKIINLQIQSFFGVKSFL
jgi:hypothetical protein